jgi:hypothetical protein
MKREKEKAFINERRYNLSMCSGDPETRVLALTDCLEELFLTKTSEPRHTHTHLHVLLRIKTRIRYLLSHALSQIPNPRRTT